MPVTPYLGSLMVFAGDFAPVGWAFCDGTLLPIDGNAALYQVLGTRYGGDGASTFGLPDLRGRVVVGYGQGPGRNSWQLAESAGVEEVTLTGVTMPAHSHRLDASGARGTQARPAGAMLAAGPQMYAGSADVFLNPQAVASSGGGQPHANLAPSLAMSYVIAISGLFPVRS